MGEGTGGKWLASVAVVGAYGALALVLQRSLLPVVDTDVYAQAMLGNDCLLHAWTLAWDHHALATQPCAVFDANIFYPHRATLLYSDHLLGLAVLLWPLRLFTDDSLWIHNLATIAAPAANALALYALARELTGMRGAAFVGGLVYGFAPVRFEADRCQIQMLAAWWLPLILLWARGAIRGGRVRDAVAAGGSLAMQGLTGIYLTAYFAPFLVLAHLLWLRRYPLRTHRRGWTALVAAEVVAVLALVPSSLAYRHVQADLGTSRAIYTNALLSLQPASLPEYLPVLTLGVLVVCALCLWRRVPPQARREGPLFVAMAVGGLVLALGPAIPVPTGGAVLGPYRLLMSVPGFVALRAPGSMVHVAVLGMAMLVAAGIAALATRTTRAGRAALVAGIAGAFLVESWPAVMPTLRVPERRDLGAALDWLLAHHDRARIVVLPIDPYGLSSAVHQYASTWHWTPMLNGNMGLMPPVYPYVLREIGRFPDTDVVADLHALGVTDVVARTDRLPAAKDGRLAAALAAPHPAMKRVLEDRGTTILAIRPSLVPEPVRLAGRVVDRLRWTATASHAAGEASRAIDASRETSWRSWSDLEVELGRWYQPMAIPARAAAFEASLPVWLAIDLADTAVLTAVELDVGGTDPLLAPNLAVELSADGTAWRPAPGRLRAMPTIRALVERPREGRYGMAFREPVRARYVRIVGNGLDLRVADVRLYAR
ncbi:MAG: hypothetical protein ACREQL_06190 [Candidatus Binatia bacterium]